MHLSWETLPGSVFFSVFVVIIHGSGHLIPIFGDREMKASATNVERKFVSAMCIKRPPGKTYQ